MYLAFFSFFFLFSFLPALLSFLSPERVKKKKKANMVGIIITKRKEKEEMNTTGNTAGLEAFFISFSFKSFVSVGGLAITCGVVLRLARSLFSGTSFWSVM